MKGLFIGLIIGAIATWCWFQTGGKVSITETKTITVIDTNWVTKTETRYFNETKWITKTNEVWKTNIIEQVAKIVPIAPKTIEQVKPILATPVILVKTQIVESAAQPKSTIKKKADNFGEFGRSRPAGRVTGGGGRTIGGKTTSANPRND